MRKALFLIGACIVLNSAAGDLPAQAGQLRDAYRESVEAAIATAQSRYLSELSKLFERAARDGDIETAAAIRREIDEIPVQFVLGEWKYLDSTSPDWQGFFLNPDGTAKHSNGAKGTWKIRGREIVVEWENKFSYHLPLLPLGLETKGRIFTPGNRQEKFRVSRVEIKDPAGN